MIGAHQHIDARDEKKSARATRMATGADQDTWRDYLDALETAGGTETDEGEQTAADLAEMGLILVEGDQ